MRGTLILLIVSIVALWLGLVLTGRPRAPTPEISLDEPRREWRPVVPALPLPAAGPRRMRPDRPLNAPDLPTGMVVARLADAPGQGDVHLRYPVDMPAFTPSPPPPPWRGR